MARTMGFNRMSVILFFSNLREVVGKYHILPNRTFNMDESGFQTVPNKLQKHVAPTGKKDVAKSVAAEQGKTVTVACGISASGQFVPPFFIFARKKINPILIKDASLGSDMAVTDKAYMNSEKFVDYLDHFKKHTKPTATDPALLILDNHISHVSRAAIVHAKKSHIHMLSLPPHTSHKLQPLDRSFFGPMKTYYDDACDSWSNSHLGQTVSEYHVSGFVKVAFGRAASLATAINGFRKTGINPINEQIFTEEDFSPAEVTEQENPGIDTF